MPKKRKAAKKRAVKKAPKVFKPKKYTHDTHPGVKQDHQTLFIFWVVSALLLIVVVALLRAAS